MARTTKERVSDARNKLEDGGDAWLATSGERGPHLIPLSLAWDKQKEEIIFCTELHSRTVRNIEDGQSSVRVGFGPTRDVLMVYGNARVAEPVGADARTAEVFAEVTGWDPRGDSGNLIFIRIVPDRMQAWREVDEISGRTIMRDSQWLA